MKIIISVTLMCMFLFSCEKKKVSTEKMDSVSYSRFVEGDFIGFDAEKIEAMMGEPDIVRKTKSSEVWHYGPDVDASLHGPPGAVVGITICFDMEKKVVDVTAVKKTAFLNNQGTNNK